MCQKWRLQRRSRGSWSPPGLFLASIHLRAARLRTPREHAVAGWKKLTKVFPARKQRKIKIFDSNSTRGKADKSPEKKRKNTLRFELQQGGGEYAPVRIEPRLLPAAAHGVQTRALCGQGWCGSSHTFRHAQLLRGAACPSDGWWAGRLPRLHMHQ